MSIYLTPIRRTKGMRLPLLEAGFKWLITHHPSTRKFKAKILASNTASRRLFREAGYIEHDSSFILTIAGTTSNGDPFMVRHSGARK